MCNFHVEPAYVISHFVCVNGHLNDIGLADDPVEDICDALQKVGIG